MDGSVGTVWVGTEVVAALNVSTSATRDSVEHVLEAYLPPLLRTAGAIDAELRLV